MSVFTKIIKGPVYPYGRRTEPGTAYIVTDRYHIPHNKRYSGGSICELTVDQRSDWVSIRLEETTIDKNGVRSSRTISTTLPRDMAETIARHILEGPRDYPKT